MTIVMNAMFQMFSIGSNVWLSKWSNDNETVINGTAITWKRDRYLGIYGALGIGQGKIPEETGLSYHHYFALNKPTNRHQKLPHLMLRITV